MQLAILSALPVLIVLEAAVSVERWAHDMWALLRRASRSADARERLDNTRGPSPVNLRTVHRGCDGDLFCTPDPAVRVPAGLGVSPIVPTPPLTGSAPSCSPDCAESDRE